MNEYLIRVDSDPLKHLANLWMASPDPATISNADAEADRLLRMHPIRHGEEMSEGLFRLIVPPLAFYYIIESSAPAVTITDILEVRAKP